MIGAAGVFALVGLLSLCGVAGAASAPAPASTPGPAGAIVSPDFLQNGLARLNHYRSLLKLPPVTDDKAAREAATAHARYLIENKIPGGDVVFEDGHMRINLRATLWHEEKRGNRWYSEEGATIGWASAVVSSDDLKLTGTEFVDRLLSMPIQSIGFVQPQISSVGEGKVCKGGRCVVVFIVHQGLEKNVRASLYVDQGALLWNPLLGTIPGWYGRLRNPIEFPPGASTTTITTYAGHDFPDPLSACPGYAAPTGAPISIQFGSEPERHGMVRITGHSITRDGKKIENCLITPYSYKGPEPSPTPIPAATAAPVAGASPSATPTARRPMTQTQMGRRFLSFLGAALMIPRKPLEPGTYNVSVTAGDRTYAWSFKVAAKTHGARGNPR